MAVHAFSVSYHISRNTAYNLVDFAIFVVDSNIVGSLLLIFK